MTAIRKNYYPQLDAIRGLAAISIIILHWFSEGYLKSFELNPIGNTGFLNYGVQIFFVLSGFLITERLLVVKRIRSQKLRRILNFAGRRILRIVPLYLLFILLLLLFFKSDFLAENIWYYLTFTFNFKLYFEGGGVDLLTNHLWTISIEEQFYLLFPLFFVFIPRKMEIPLVLLLIAGSILFQYYFIHSSTGFLLTPYQADMIGLGILIALIKENYPKFPAKLSARPYKILLICALIAAILVYHNSSLYPALPYLLRPLLICAFGLLIILGINGINGVIGKILESNTLLFIGKISYGLYIFHKVIPVAFGYNQFEFYGYLDYALLNGGVLWAAAWISWKFYEKPVLSLKKHFPL